MHHPRRPRKGAHYLPRRPRLPHPDLLPSLQRILESRRPEDAVVILGVGSELRSDDAVGLHVARALAALKLPGVHALEAGPAPENSTADIRAIHPAYVLIVDAASVGAPPGTIRLIDPANIGGASFGTHGLPLTVLAAYLRTEIGSLVTIIGIQPASVDYGEEMSPAAVTAGEAVAATLAAVLS